jgi:hypothetical protein
MAAGTYAICPIFRWEDDWAQFRDPHYRGGANKVSLAEARASFEAIGVSDPRRRDRAREPTAEVRANRDPDPSN